MELVTIENLVDEEWKKRGRSEAVDVVAERLGVTRATIYRWLKSGDHYFVDDSDIGCESVFKLVKCNPV